MKKRWQKILNEKNSVRLIYFLAGILLLFAATGLIDAVRAWKFTSEDEIRLITSNLFYSGMLLAMTRIVEK